MTNEEKVKAYDEALKRAKNIKSKILQSHLSTESCKAVSEYIDEIIPELRESEDERIRKEIIDFLETIPASELKRIPRPISEWFSYLKKQKDQKPAEKQDYSGLNDCERAIHRGFLVAGVENVPVGIIKETAKDCIAHFPWPTKWNKEDERILKGIIGKIDHDQTYGVSKVEMLSFLEGLRPSWKPSEEQMRALINIICFGKISYVGQEEELIALKNQLKKLM